MAAVRSSVVDRDGARKADLAAIHIGKKALGLDDDAYRDLLWTVCQVRSAGDLDFGGRKRFLAHLKACGWVNEATHGTRRPRKAWNPQQRKVWSLWQQLADAGLVQSREKRALNGWIKGWIKVDALDFMNPQQLDHAVEMLKRWLARRQEPA